MVEDTASQEREHACVLRNHLPQLIDPGLGSAEKGQVQADRLSGIDVARVAKKLALRAGLDATAYAGHSLRAGHATSAAIAGASEWSIMKQTGHRSVQMVRRYIRDGSLFRENSAGKLGL
jgi:integrase